MAYYPSLRDYKTKTERTRIIDNILRLKAAISQQVPAKTLDTNLLLATWNIRELGKNDKAVRLKESFYYMAEIISAYDLVAVQEIAQDLSDLKTLIKILGPDWDYIVTDITEGASGNGERLAFIYDKRKVAFRKIAGELVLPDTKDGEKQIARTPFFVAFQSGWFRFYITTVHIFYGNDVKSGPEYKRRVKEIADIAAFLKKRSKKEVSNYLLLGDFNITGRDNTDPTMQALTSGGFKIPDNLIQLANANTNTDRTKPYDQIAYIDQKGFMEFVNSDKSVGVFDFFSQVFRAEDEAVYQKEQAKSNIKTYKQWKTFQMSDHLPLWIEFKVDFSENYLNKLKTDEYDK
jgi:exonuclease III